MGRMNYGVSTPKQTTEATKGSSKSKLDFRYADSEDAFDVAGVVNEAYSFAFDEACSDDKPSIDDKVKHASITRTTVLNVINDLNSGYNWLCVEAPPPAYRPGLPIQLRRPLQPVNFDTLAREEFLPGHHPGLGERHAKRGQRRT